MLRCSRLGLTFALLFCYPAAYAGSIANKCTDGQQITYANMPCEDLGLKSIGPVKNAIVVVPAVQKSKKDSSENPSGEHDNKNDAPKDDASGSDVSGAGKIKPTNSLIEKLMQ
jgi:hypothetical protein